MKRYHLFEFHELSRCPSFLRDCITDFLATFLQIFNPYKVVTERIDHAVADAGATAIVDLCSGGAQPVLAVKAALETNGRNVPFVITDKYPNTQAFKEIEATHQGITPSYESIDAANVPEELRGFRTLFTAFHHFDEEAALGIITDAVRKEQGIGIFEYTERSLPWVGYVLAIPFAVFWVTLFTRPFSWVRVLLTYVIPVIPLMVLFDGAVSCLRSYSPAELEELIQSIEPGASSCQYQWEIGYIRTLNLMRITYVIGTPQRIEKA